MWTADGEFGDICRPTTIRIPSEVMFRNNEATMKHASRPSQFGEKVIFVDGLPGCGKTLVSQLISALDRVELTSYSYEIEIACALYSLGRISLDGAVTQIRIQADLKLYNTMMGRDVNFRRADLSSVYNNHDPGRYFKRLFAAGDEVTPSVISTERPILNLAVHHLLSYSEPVFLALDDRCCFVEVVRHPLYMIKQQALNFDSLICDVRDFTVYYEHGNTHLPFYADGWEEDFLGANAIERAIHLIYNMTKRAEMARAERLAHNAMGVVTIPFEKLVKDPVRYLVDIASRVDSGLSDITYRVMREQNVPRTLVADGIDLPIYRRCGWEPSRTNSEIGELRRRKEEFFSQIGHRERDILERLCHDYENNFWSPSECCFDYVVAP